MSFFNFCQKLFIDRANFKQITYTAKACFSHRVFAQDNFLKSSKWHCLLTRNIKKSKEKTPVLHTHLWDKVPSGFIIVYGCHLKNWIAGIQLISLFGGISIPLYCIMDYHRLNDYFSFTEKILILSVLASMVVAAIYINLMARNFVLRIYYNNGEFIAVRRSIFGRLKKLSYTPSDVSYKDQNNLGMEEGTEVAIKNSKCYLYAADFISPAYYNMHFGDHSAVRLTISDFPKF